MSKLGVFNKIKHIRLMNSIGVSNKFLFFSIFKFCYLRTDKNLRRSSV